MKIKIILITLCFLCFGVIFFNSSQISKVSNTRSREVVDEIIKVASETKGGQILLKKVDPTELNVIVRKIAHGFEFFLLGLILRFTFKHFKVEDNNVLIYTLFIVLFVAVLDEFFQLFIEGRGSRIIDVLIDFCGGVLSNVLFLVFPKPKGKRYKNSKDITYSKRSANTYKNYKAN